MSTDRVQKYSEAEYLEWERAAPEKHQFYQGEIFQMAGASRQHNLIVTNLIREFGNQLRRRCRVYPSDLRVLVQATGLYTYPDVTVVCGDEQFLDEQFDTLTNPTVVFEVLSDSTEQFDRDQKFRHYQNVASLKSYVLVSQNRAAIDLLERLDDGHWRLTPIEGLDGQLRIESIHCDVPLSEIYADVEFPPPRVQPGLFRDNAPL